MDDRRAALVFSLLALAGEQGARQPLRLTRGLAQRGTRTCVGPLSEADVARCRAGRRCERPARPRTGESKQGEHERGALVIHDCTLTARQPPNGIRSTPASPKDCGS